MDNLENILSYDAICAKYNVSCSSKMYDEIIKNILLQMIKLVKEQVKYSTINPKIPDLKIENINCADQNVLTSFRGIVCETSLCPLATRLKV